MAIVKKVKNGWIVVSEGTGIPLVNRVFNSKSAATSYASKLTPGFY